MDSRALANKLYDMWRNRRRAPSGPMGQMLGMEPYVIHGTGIDLSVLLDAAEALNELSAKLAVRERRIGALEAELGRARGKPVPTAFDTLPDDYECPH